MTWTVHVKKGPWVDKIQELRWSMINGGVSRDYTGELKTSGRSFQENCHGIRLFSEAVRDSGINLYGFKKSIAVAIEYANWAAHSKNDKRYKHTDVTTSHMKKLVNAFKNIVKHLIEQVSYDCSSSESESSDCDDYSRQSYEVSDLVDCIDALGLY